MIAEIIKGTLVLMPANDTEHYALTKWAQDARVEVSDPARNESEYIRGSCVKLRTPVLPAFVPPA